MWIVSNHIINFLTSVRTISFNRRDVLMGRTPKKRTSRHARSFLFLRSTVLSERRNPNIHQQSDRMRIDRPFGGQQSLPKKDGRAAP